MEDIEESKTPRSDAVIFSNQATSMTHDQENLADILFSTSSQALLWLNPATAEVLAANPAFLRLVGVSSSEKISLVALFNASLNTTDLASLSMEEPLKRTLQPKNGAAFSVTLHLLYRCQNQTGGIVVRVEKNLSAFAAEKMVFLSESNGLMRSVIDVIPEMVFVKDLQGRYIACNKAFSNFYNIPEEDLLGKTTEELYSSEVTTTYQQQDKDILLQGGVSSINLWLTRHDGEKILAETVKTAYYDKDGVPQGFVGITYDITEQYKIQKKLSADRKMMRSFIDAIPDPVFFRDSEARLLDCNKAFLEVVGKPLEEILGKTDRDWFPPEIGEPLYQADMAVIRSKKICITQDSVQSPEGEDQRFEATKAPYFTEDGEVAGLVGIARNVTEQYRTQKKLGNERAMMRSILDTIPDPVFVKDINHRYTASNKAFDDFFSTRETLIFGKTDQELNLAVEVNHIARFEEDTLVYKAPVSTHLRMTRADGKVVHTDIILAPRYDEDGIISGIVGVIHDVTEH